MSQPLPAVSLKNVTIKYHDTFEPVVINVSFDIAPSSIAMLIGPNGSGKTSLIKATLGLLPYQGSIKVAGRDLEACHHAIGYVPQTHTIDLSFPMTVREFLHYSHSNCPDYLNREDHIARTLNQIKAHNLLNKPLNQLSGGQLQRVLLARAIMHQPKLIILDEPEAGIDVGGEQTLYDLLVSLKEQHHITLLIATHEIDLVYHYADQVICLNKKLVCNGDPKQALNEATLHQLYGRHLRPIVHPERYAT